MNRIGSISAALVDGAQAVAFWLAVLLPFAHIPALHDSLLGHQPALSGALLALNGICLLIGHNHHS